MRLRLAIGALLVIVASVTSVPSAFAAVLGPPTALTATPSTNQVTLAWTAPAVGGNPAISDYYVEYSSDNGVSWTVFSHTASTTASRAVTSLLNNQSYAFRVSTVNADGVGTPTAPVTAIPVSSHTANDLPMFTACPTALVPEAGFTDVSLAEVNCIKYYGITKGTTETTYSPNDTVTRWQMALFLTRMADRAGITLGDGSAQGFTDIGGYSVEIQTAINQIKQMGVTVGKTATTFAPAADTTREEMAMFVTRLLKKALVGPGGNEEFVTGTTGAKELKSIDADSNYSDLNLVSIWEAKDSIVNLWNLGATDVQAGLNFDPQGKMTRRAMATFMANALSHTNARPKGMVLQAETYRVSGTPSINMSVTYRTTEFEPIAGAYVDTFKFQHTIAATPVRFDSAGNCSGTAATSGDSSKCMVMASDSVTDIKGNTALFFAYPQALVKTDYWAWTSDTGTAYDNDLHASAASKITIETTP